MAKRTQAKALLGLFKADGTLHTVVDCPGAEVHYRDDLYTVVEADTLDDVLKDKPAPSLKVLGRALPSATPDELQTEKRRLDTRKVAVVEISK